MASILVLGPVEVRHGDRALLFARQQERFILGVLALEVGRPVATDRLIDLLWGDNPPRSARAVLQTRVSELRTALASFLGGPEAGFGAPGDAANVAVTIESRRSAYVLMAPEQVVDAYVFLQQARGWRSAGTRYQYVVAAASKRVSYGVYVGHVDESRQWIPDLDVATVVASHPSQWFETERPHILTLVRRAAADGDDSVCCALVRLAASLFEMRRYFDDWLAIVEMGRAAAEHSHDLCDEAALLIMHAQVRLELRRYEEGRADLANAAAIFDRLGDATGRATVTTFLGCFDRQEGDVSSAFVHFERAASELANSGNRPAFGFAARYLAQAHQTGGNDSDAETWFAAALDAYRSVDGHVGEAQVLVHHGFMLVFRGEIDRATQQFEEAHAYVREIGDLAGTAQCLRALAAADRARGDIDAARTKLTEALQIVRQPKPTLMERLVSTDLQRLDEPLDRATADA